MHVCLISPPTVSHLRDRSWEPAVARALAAQSAPLGILTLAAALEQQGHAVTIVDLNRELYSFVQSERQETRFGGFAERVADALASTTADVYGFATIWSSYPFTLRVAEGVKQRMRQAVTVLGGPQASVTHSGTMASFPQVDAVVRGEADETFSAFMAALEGKAHLEAVAGLSVRRGQDVLVTPDAPPVSDLDALPFPAFHLYGDLGDFHHLPLELGRGCPFGCKFCSTNEFFSRRFRVKSPSRLIGDMKTLNAAYGVTRFDLIHDMFTANRATVTSFCEAMIEADTGFTWYCSARTDCVDAELLGLMAEAGCRSVFFGVETGSPRLQTLIGKHLDLEAAAAQLDTTSRLGMEGTLSLIVGHPDETRADLRETVRFLFEALRHDGITPQIHLLTPLNETPLELAFREQLVFDDVYGDLSHSGWPQEPPDRRLIAGNPGIFAPFYSLPITHLNRRWIQELRLFLYHGILRHRWVLVHLHGQGDLLEIFDAWRPWLREAHPEFEHDTRETMHFYGTEAWSAAFLRFVRESFLTPEDDALAALLEYSDKLESALAEAATVRRGASRGVRRRPGVHLLQVSAALPRVLESLREGSPPRPVGPARTVVVTIPNGGHLEVVQLSPLLTDVLRLCDGQASEQEVIRRVGREERALAGLPPRLVAELALEQLREGGFVADGPARPKEHSQRLVAGTASA